LALTGPPFIIVDAAAVTVILVRGIKESAANQQHHGTSENNCHSGVRDFLPFKFIHPANYHPFAPNGWPGNFDGAAQSSSSPILDSISVSTAAEEW